MTLYTTKLFPGLSRPVSTPVCSCVYSVVDRSSSVNFSFFMLGTGFFLFKTSHVCSLLRLSRLTRDYEILLG